MIKPGRAPDYRDRGYATKGPASRAIVGRSARLPTDELDECERMITQGFQQVAAAVARIKTNQLYLKAGYTSFETYCQDRWGWKRGRGDQLENAHSVLQLLPKQFIPLVANERQARALSEVPKEKRVNVLKSAVKSGAVTAKSIRQAAGIQPTQKVIDIEPEPAEKHCPTCTCERRQRTIEVLMAIRFANFTQTRQCDQYGADT